MLTSEFDISCTRQTRKVAVIPMTTTMYAEACSKNRIRSHSMDPRLRILLPMAAGFALCSCLIQLAYNDIGHGVKQ